MPTFKGKDGKSVFHPNPQMGKAMHQPFESTKGKAPHEQNMEHEKPGQEGEKSQASHVEIHRGPHEHGKPPAHEGHTHHVIVHHGGGGGGGGLHHESGGSGGGEADIHNHDSYDSAEADMRSSMGEDNMMDPMGMSDQGEYGGAGDETEV